MIYQLRGTCASGKTTAVRRFVTDYPSTSIDVEPDHPFALVSVTNEKGRTVKVSKKVAAEKYGDQTPVPKRTHIGFALPGDLIVLGKYGKAASGGVEGVPQDWIRDLVEYTGMNHDFVLFEGYHASVPTLVWIPMLERLRDAGVPVHIAALNTPFDVCMERVHARTPDRQDRKPTNVPVQLEHFNQLHERAMPFFATRPDLCSTWYVDYLRPFEQIRDELIEAGWRG